MYNGRHKSTFNSQICAGAQCTRVIKMSQNIQIIEIGKNVWKEGKDESVSADEGSHKKEFSQDKVKCDFLICLENLC